MDIERIISDKRDITYLNRAFIFGMLPYKKVSSDVKDIVYDYGNIMFSIQRSPEKFYEIPYGTMARLLLHYISNEARTSNSRIVSFGKSLTSFLRHVGLSTGGKMMNKAKQQLLNILGVRFSLTKYRWDDGLNKKIIEKTEWREIADAVLMDWNDEHYGLHPQLDNIKTGEKNLIKLTESFYDDTKKHAFPLDMNVIRKIKNHALALDIYAWRNYKSFNAKSEKIKWEYLMTQFGTSMEINSKTKYRFIEMFTKTVHELKNVCDVDNLIPEKDGLLFIESTPQKLF